MSITAIIAAIFVLATIGLIVIDSVRSHRKEKVRQVQHDTGRVFHSERMKQSGVPEVETKIRKSMEEIVRFSPAPTPPPDIDATPREMSAVNPANDETRCMKAVREKAEEVHRIVNKKAKT